MYPVSGMGDHTGGRPRGLRGDARGQLEAPGAPGRVLGHRGEARLAGQTVWGLYSALTRWSTHAPLPTVALSS